MLTISANQYEFENPSTEESIELAIEKIGNSSSSPEMFISQVIGVVAAEKLGNPTPFNENFGYGLVRKYMAHFANFVIPNPCNWPTYVLESGPDEWHIIICSSEHYISYRWETSA